MLTYRRDVDGLRAIAVVPVVLYHAGLPGLTGGFIGVDVFFVISGFLITSIIMNDIATDRFSLIRFYEKRARRILPALFAIVVTTQIVGWFVFLPDSFKDLGQSTLATALFVSNIYFTLKLDYFSQAAELAPLLHTWSLAVEEQFYLFYPPMLAFLFAWRGRMTAVWIVIGLSVLSLLCAIVFLPVKPDWVFYLIVFRAWELGLGSLVALCLLRAPQSRLVRDIVGIAALAAILIPVFAYSSSTQFPGLAAVPPVLGAAALIYVGTNGARHLVGTLLSHKFFVGIGLISYSLYLWHWPILAFMRSAQPGAHLPLWLGAIAVVLSIFLAWISYKYVEQPFRAPPPNGFSRGSVFKMSGGVLGVMILAGGIVHLGNGMPNRFAPEVVAMAAVEKDSNPDRRACINLRPEDGFCPIGVPAQQDDPIDFLFWGDSHAEAMRGGVEIAAQEAGQRGLFAGGTGCAPLWAVQKLPDRWDCVGFNDGVQTMLADRTDIPLVVLSARWVFSVEGDRYRQEIGPDVSFDWTGTAEFAPDGEDNAAVVEASLRFTVSQITDSGRRVVILGSVPEMGQNVAETLVKSEIFPWYQDLQPVTEADFEERAGRSETMLRQIANDIDRVDYINLSSLFCQNGVCAYAGEDGVPYYIDDDHLSSKAARTLLPERLSQIWAGRP